MRLTDLRVQSLPAPEKGQRVYRCDSLKGFACRVSQGGTKTFVLITGKERSYTTLGAYPTISLAQAREVAKRLLAERTLGRHQTPRIAFSEALDLYTTQHIAQLAPRTQKELGRLFARYLTRLRSKRLADLTTHDITAITDKCAPSEAEHLHRAARAFLRWCVRRRLLQHSPLDGLEAPSKWKPRERVLSDDELRAVWRATADGGTFSHIVRLLILTGARRSEVAHMRLEGSVVALDASVTKNRRAHRFPVGDTAQCILEAHPALSWNGWSKAKAQLDKKAKIAPWTLHDLRRTYATNLQRLGIKLEVIEALLNHASGTRAGIVGVYQKHRFWEEMCEATETYERWLRENIICHDPAQQNGRMSKLRDTPTTTPTSPTTSS